jgi:hypothetical protein
MDASFEGIAKYVYEEGILETPQSFSKPKLNIRTLCTFCDSIIIFVFRITTVIKRKTTSTPKECNPMV